MVNEIVKFILSITSGLFLGVLYFWMLWKTIKKLPKSKQPVMIILKSLATRIIPLMAAFYLLLQIGWKYALTAVLGFMIARLVFLYSVNAKTKKQAV